MDNPDKSLQYLKELESLGEEILVDRQEIIALDKRRNETREGLRELKNSKVTKTWFALGPLLLKFPTNKVENLLKKDQVQVDAEINKLRSNLKVKVNLLRDMEHQPPVPGLMLKPMSKQEMNAMGHVLGRC
ncbi:p53 and DNA damage-regulated protein, putative [Pediculus humanus corporis]|uniref:p53 and DNA damage-regulated protein, Putative n=1 Tax=Pediculus humanus subsp. corporis TaxID=121224 RepID=E0VQ54_PEDHC|nr:p53 and DNA damage-regulated protein, putative [Pediculus humanus corporis]EEB15510.1 p53 and DNA damage-regulated protein, putative [Pediculus humanus corporis]